MVNKKIDLVYILGTSYSGSSLLGFLMGSSKKVFNAGELNHFNRNQEIGGEICSCGKNSLKCSLWKELYKKNHKIYQRPSFLKRVSISLQIIFGKKFKLKSTNKLEYFFLKDLLEEINKKDKSVKYILDASKSLWRLRELMNDPHINLNVIYITREIEGNVYSFYKYEGFWKGIFVYKLNNFLIKRFLRFNNLRYLNVNYKLLCNGSARVLDQIGAFLDIDYSNYLKKVRNRKYHVPSGNQGTRKQFLRKFEGLRYDDSWEGKLSKLQKFILRLFK